MFGFSCSILFSLAALTSNTNTFARKFRKAMAADKEREKYPRKISERQRLRAKALNHQEFVHTSFDLHIFPKRNEKVYVEI